MAHRAICYKYDSGFIEADGRLAIQAFTAFIDTQYDPIVPSGVPPQLLPINIELDTTAPAGWDLAIKAAITAKGTELGFTIPNLNLVKPVIGTTIP